MNDIDERPDPLILEPLEPLDHLAPLEPLEGNENIATQMWATNTETGMVIKIGFFFLLSMTIFIEFLGSNKCRRS